MKTNELIKKLEGIHTIDSVMDILNVNKDIAINLISKLRKKGYVKTKQLQNKVRVYNISRKNRLLGESYYDIINKFSPIKISETQIYKIYGRKPTLEETLIFAIKTKKLRVILASLSLFKHINNWTLLGELSRKNYIERKVGILYDLSRTIFKVRRMSKKLRISILPIEEEYVYLVEGLRSKDFKKLEEKWNVYLPFNKEDLEEYLIK